MKSNRVRPSFTHLARREQMIQATIETVAATGLQQATLAKIADRLGIAKGGIIYHFDGRDQLIDAALTQVYERIGQAVEDHVAGAASTRDGVRRYITALMGYLDEHRLEVRLIAEAFARPQDPERADEQVESRWRNLAELIEAAMAEEATSHSGALDPKVLAISVSGAIDALIAQGLREPDFDVKQAAEGLAQAIDTLIAPRASGEDTAIRKETP